MFRIQVYYPVEDFLGIDGEAMELEWNLFPGFTTLQNLEQIQNDLQSENTAPEQLFDRIIFMSMFNDIDWTKKENNEETCTSNSEQVKWYAQRFQKGHWTFIGPVDEWKWYGTREYRPEGKWNSIAAKMIRNFLETNHPVFTSISALNRGILKQAKGKTSIHFNAEMTNSELLLKIKFCANQLSIYGAVACWCYQYGAKEDEEAGNPSPHEEIVNKGLMNRKRCLDPRFFL